MTPSASLGTSTSKVFVGFRLAVILPLTLLTSLFYTQQSNSAELYSEDWQKKTKQDIEQSCLTDQNNCLCQGMYVEPPRIDLGLSSDNPDSLLAAADRYSINEAGVAELRGDVVLQQQDMQVESVTVTLDRKKNLATIRGHARFRQTDFLLLGEQAVVDLETKDANFSKAQYLTHSKGLRGQAETIEVKGSGGLSIHDGSYTSCAPNDDSWHVQGKEIILDRESGWGTAKHMTLNVKEIPVFYTPYFKFPIDDRRHTGFLYPRLNVNKPDIATPYYINIAPNYDATITPRRIGQRGDMLEGQFRYLTHPTGLGEINIGYLPNDDNFDYQDRKLLNWTQTSRWNNHWSGEVDVNYTSDNDYFTDFDSSFTIQSISHLERKAALLYIDDNWRFSTRIQSYQTIDDLILEGDRPYRRLPEIRLKGDHLIAGVNGGVSQLHWLNQLEYVYFEQQYDSNAPYAHRGNLNSALEWRLRWPWGYLTSAARLQHTHYLLTGEPNAGSDERDLSTPMTSIDGGLVLERAFSFNGGDWLQTLEPRLFYVNIPFEEQSDIPLFDTSGLTFGYGQLFRENRFSGGDRIGDTEQISLGLTTRFINTTSGQEVLTASAGQIIYLKDRKVQLNENDNNLDSYDRSAIAIDLRARLNNKWRMSTGAVWDEETNTLENASFTAGYKATSKQHWNLGYRYRVEDTNDRIAQAELSLAQKINAHWRFTGLWHFDLQNNTTVEQLTGLTYESCCWNNSIVYRRKITDTTSTNDLQDNDYGLFFLIELKDLTGLEIEI